jgi:transcriptional regulator with GAF, ATPase, and Fis domain
LGKFTLADGGTIFLDEIGELPLELQPKLLRVLQEMEFDELGSTKTKKVDVRVIAATNRDLKEMIRDGRFREDLYYRLNVFPIHNIPLRARKDDIPLLTQFFLEKYAMKAGKVFNRVSKDTIDVLLNYNFPGNIRELENMIERAVIVENGPTLKPGSWIPLKDIPASSIGFKSFESIQKDYIIEVLDHTNWRVSGPSGAAKILKMKDKTLFAKMKRLGIEKKVSLKRNPPETT